MKIDQIRQVLEVYKTGSINKAAQNLYIAQSSLSASIRTIEIELSRKIFIRTQSGIVATEFGLSFIEEGEKILKHYQKILSVADEKNKYDLKDRFSISVYFLLFASRAFHVIYNKYSHENIDFCYSEKSRIEIIDDVASGEAEIGMLVMTSIKKEQWLSYITSHGLDYYLLSIEVPCVLFGQACELYHRNLKEVFMSDLAPYNMIAIEDQNELFRSINKEIFHRFKPRTYINISDRGSLMGMLRQTDGYYLATTNKNAYKKQEDFYRDIKSLPVKDANFYNYEIGYVRKRKTPLSPLAVEYIELIKKVIE